MWLSALPRTQWRHQDLKGNWVILCSSISVCDGSCRSKSKMSLSCILSSLRLVSVYFVGEHLASLHLVDTDLHNYQDEKCSGLLRPDTKGPKSRSPRRSRVSRSRAACQWAFSMRPRSSANTTPSRLATVLDTSASGFLKSVTLNNILLLAPFVASKSTRFLPRFSILVPLAATKQAPRIDPGEGCREISGRSFRGITFTAAPESMVILPVFFPSSQPPCLHLHPSL